MNKHSPQIRVTVQDLTTGDEESITLSDDYVLITAGSCELVRKDVYGYGRHHLLTIAGRKNPKPALNLHVGVDAPPEGDWLWCTGTPEEGHRNGECPITDRRADHAPVESDDRYVQCSETEGGHPKGECPVNDAPLEPPSPRGADVR